MHLAGMPKFDELCSTAEVAQAIKAADSGRSGALKKFWLRLLLGTAAALGLFWALLEFGSITQAVLALLLGLIVTAAFAIHFVGQAGDELSQAVSEQLAEATGMKFVASDFEPPAIAEAAPILLPRSKLMFSGLFYGSMPAGGRCAFYQLQVQGLGGPP